MYDHSSLVFAARQADSLTDVMMVMTLATLAAEQIEADADIISTLTLIRSTLLLAAVITAQRASCDKIT